MRIALLVTPFWKQMRQKTTSRGSTIDDGLMDVVIAGPLTRKRLLGALSKIYSGSHLGMEEVQYVQGKMAQIRTIPAKTMLPDGEILGQTPGIIEVYPRKIRYLS